MDTISEEITTIEEVQGLMEKYPVLHDSGFGYGGSWRTPKEEQQVFIEGCRQTMLKPEFIKMVDACRVWLKGATKTKIVNTRSGSSYHYKHVVEREVRFHISNGAFIAATLLDGFIMSKKGYNRHFNISKRRVKEVA